MSVMTVVELRITYRISSVVFMMLVAYLYKDTKTDFSKNYET